MMRYFPWALALVTTAAFLLMRDAAAWNASELSEAEDSIAVLEPAVRNLTEEVAILMAEAFRRDTVLTTYTDTVFIRVEKANSVGDAALDSLFALADTVEARHLETLQASHEEEVAGIQLVSHQRLLWGEGWRSLALASDSLVKAQAAQIALYAQVNVGLRSAMKRREIEYRVTQAVAAAGAGKICYDAINEGQVGLAVGSCAVAVFVGIP